VVAGRRIDGMGVDHVTMGVDATTLTGAKIAAREADVMGIVEFEPILSDEEVVSTRCRALKASE